MPLLHLPEVDSGTNVLKRSDARTATQAVGMGCENPGTDAGSPFRCDRELDRASRHFEKLNSSADRDRQKTAEARNLNRHGVEYHSVAAVTLPSADDAAARWAVTPVAQPVAAVRKTMPGRTAPAARHRETLESRAIAISQSHKTRCAGRGLAIRR